MSKISELSDGGALQSTDYLIAVRSGGNVKVQPGSMTVDINGGTIDGVTIGGSSAGAGSFTTLTASGDVNFDSGTLFVDASADAVGIGTSSLPTNSQLTVYGSTDGKLGVGGPANAGATGEGVGLSSYNGTHVAIQPFYLRASQVVFRDSSGETARIDASGNVGIGTDSPSANLTVADGPLSTDLIMRASSNYVSIDANEGGTAAAPALIVGGDADTGWYRPTSNTIGLSTGGSEAMRIDSSQNLLVGRTSTITFGSNTTTGAVINEDGRIDAATDGQASLIIQRLNSDGNIANFYKDGTQVGSIGVYSSGLYIGSTAGSDAFIGFTNSIVYPSTSAGAGRDAAIDLGSSGSRFKDLYLSGGVYLGGTGAANLLDDYEEGTWTPTTNSDATGTLTNAAGRYVKIGSLVTLTFSFNVGVAFTSYTIGGLPFTPVLPAGASYGTTGFFVYGNGDKYWRIDNGSTALTSVTSANASASVGNTRCTVTYHTAD